MNNKLQVKSEDDKMKSIICEYVTKEEEKITYDEENLQKFRRKIDLFESNLS